MPSTTAADKTALRFQFSLTGSVFPDNLMRLARIEIIDPLVHLAVARNSLCRDDVSHRYYVSGAFNAHSVLASITPRLDDLEFGRTLSIDMSKIRATSD